MGVLDKFLRNPNWVPGCKVDRDASTPDRVVLKCDVRDAVGDVTIRSEEEVEAIIEQNRMWIMNEGKLPKDTLEKLRHHLRTYLQK